MTTAMRSEKKYPPEIARHPDADIWVDSWKKMHTPPAQMFSALIVGPRGSGKSYTAIKMAEFLDRTHASGSRFDISRITFGAGEFSRVVGQKLPMGSFIIMDESGVTASSREAMTKVVRKINEIIQTMRKKRCGVIMCVPIRRILDKNMRLLVDCVIEMQDIDVRTKETVFKFKWNTLSEHVEEGIQRFHVRSQQEIHPWGIKLRKASKIKRLRLGMPSKELVDAYETKKDVYLDDLYKKINAEIEEPGTNKFEKHYSRVLSNLAHYLDRTLEGKVVVDWGRILLDRDITLNEVAAKKIARIINQDIERGEIKLPSGTAAGA